MTRDHARKNFLYSGIVRYGYAATLLYRIGVACIAATAAGCDSSSGPAAPSTISFSQESVALDALGATATITATVKDKDGNPLPDAVVSWSATGSAITLSAGVSPSAAPNMGQQSATQSTAVEGASVQVSALANGVAVLKATVRGISNSVGVTVAQIPTSLQKAAGDAQSAAVGTDLAQMLQVRLVDRLGMPVAGQTVGFAVEAGGGSVAPTFAATDANGLASARWTVGTSTSVTHVVKASLSGGATVQFSASATAGPPVAIVVNAGDNQTGAAGIAVATPPSVRVVDAFSNPVASVGVNFAVTGGGGTAVGAAATSGTTGIAGVSSWTLGAIPGLNSIRATSGSLPPVTMTATGLTGPAAAIAIVAGNNQNAPVALPVPTRPSVRVADQFNNPVSGANVTFAVATGGGSASGASVVTDAGGVATIGNWTLGPAPGVNTLTATVSGATFAGNPAVFTASGGAAGGYEITLSFLTSLTPTQTSAFTNAAARWASIITSDVQDLLVSVGGGTCGANSLPISSVVDDLLIFVTIAAIDGPGGVLGSAAPCFVRSSGGIPIVGQMRFDIADVAQLEASGTLQAVVLHEMGHVLGIGTRWSPAYLGNSTPAAGPPRDTFYNGIGGRAAFDLIGGLTYTGGQKVPVENTGGTGTINAHWRESVLGSELMTGFLNEGANPLSVLTIRSLEDLGYAVNVAGADPFFLSLAFSAGVRGPLLDLVGDVIDGPQYSIDSAGTIRRIR